MRLYKITAAYQAKINGKDGVDVNVTKYVGAKSEGVAYRKELMEAGAKRKDITEEEVNVPTDKTGLLAFLNGVET